ncbi:MAG: hypothetical protein NZL93_04725, partial [Chthoniobacterales bacterium]|nr:hypothetical protein [Chthoniobacterales bacterium]
QTVELETWSKGPLILRRAKWLMEVKAGKRRIVGVLPRTEEDWEGLPLDARSVLENAAVGVFSLSDLYGVHGEEEADEWLHAVYQAASPDGLGMRLAERSLWSITMMNPNRRGV